jgi:predicted nucleotidyltransferase
MIAIIEDNRTAIVELCQQFGVRELALFGSAATGAFDPATSDLDFLLELSDYGPGVGRRFMKFAVALEDLLGRPVDLVFESVMNDPDFRRSVLDTQQLLYDDPPGAKAIA